MSKLLGQSFEGKKNYRASQNFFFATSAAMLKKKELRIVRIMRASDSSSKYSKKKFSVFVRFRSLKNRFVSKKVVCKIEHSIREPKV